MIAYKLFKQRKDGSLGSLFVNRRAKLPIGQWFEAVNHRPKNLKERPYWHALEKPVAPHLSERNRVWCKVEIEDYHEMNRPEAQGGKWLLAKRLKILKKI